MDYNFEIGKPFMGIDFHDSVLNVVDKLGKPERIDRYDDDDKSYSVVYIYDDDRLMIFFEYEHDELINLLCYVYRLYINGCDLFTFRKQKVLEIIKSISKISLEDALDESYEEGDVLCEIYNFEDIGIVLWFEDDYLDDVCISAPESTIESYPEKS